ncbi:MAG: qmcA [Rickettsiales bacterium]|jgi:regulator of protease activity HflC (stomatin/prohibitin superfamily)|nr:qmcA [Rickettsiales bacterium]
MEQWGLLGFVIFFGVFLFVKGVRVVPQQQAWIIERLGKFHINLQPGLNFLIPFVDRVAYKHSLKEDAIDVPEQMAVTKDNVSLRIDGVLYIRIVDPVAASYGVSNPYFAVSQLAQTTMRSEIGKISLDNTFEEREVLNVNIVNSINEAANSWGIQCMRYEIKDIHPPVNVLEAMELQVAAERQKRARILESEGQKQAQINIADAHRQETVLRAEGQKQHIVLESEASKLDQINRAQGQAEAIRQVAEASAQGIERLAKAVISTGGEDAVKLRIAEQYIQAFEKLARVGNTILLPADLSQPGAMVAQALGVFEAIKKK